MYTRQRFNTISSKNERISACQTTQQQRAASIACPTHAYCTWTDSHLVCMCVCLCDSTPSAGGHLSNHHGDKISRRFVRAFIESSRQPLGTLFVSFQPAVRRRCAIRILTRRYFCPLSLGYSLHSVDFNRRYAFSPIYILGHRFRLDSASQELFAKLDTLISVDHVVFLARLFLWTEVFQVFVICERFNFCTRVMSKEALNVYAMRFPFHSGLSSRFHE